MSRNAKQEVAGISPPAANDPLQRVSDGGSAATYRRLVDVALWDKNPRKNDNAARDVANGIKDVGFGTACVTWFDPGQKKDVFICGNTRAKAMAILACEVKTADTSLWHPNAIELATGGLIPCRSRNDLSKREATKLALMDNRLGEKAEWDTLALASVLSEFGLDEAAVMGWGKEDFEKMAGALDVSELDPGDAFGDLPSGDKEPFQQMTFTLHDEQVETVKRAIERSKKTETFSSVNENGNGNALAAICGAYLG